MPKPPRRKRLSAAEVAKFEEERRLALQRKDAEDFGRAVRREHDALSRLLSMLDHIVGMPTIPMVVNEARSAFSAVVMRSRTPVAGDSARGFAGLP